MRWLCDGETAGTLNKFNNPLIEIAELKLIDY
ncbi:hypothetical protein SAMN05192574_11987 [Mucilaginibacter gossypiicola]|uniref:Uncharacterized protein n=1 Tax=Mucilaginibacter gossypiicola TaxID=551995 RepID=A0A1H8UIT9_9SPHI|nr:hypothetical protein SAMN05192574_11987 [Mucilaginibacter gossypiicola]